MALAAALLEDEGVGAVGKVGDGEHVVNYAEAVHVAAADWALIDGDRRAVDRHVDRHALIVARHRHSDVYYPCRAVDPRQEWVTLAVALFFFKSFVGISLRIRSADCREPATGSPTIM